MIFQFNYNADVLTGILGKKGQLYWCTVSVAKLLKYKSHQYFARCYPNELLDTVLPEYVDTTSIPGRKEKSLVFTHETLMGILHKSKKTSAQVLYKLFKKKNLHVKSDGTLDERILPICSSGDSIVEFWSWIEKCASYQLILEKSAQVLPNPVAKFKVNVSLPAIPDSKKTSFPTLEKLAPTRPISKQPDDETSVSNRSSSPEKTLSTTPLTVLEDKTLQSCSCSDCLERSPSPVSPTRLPVPQDTHDSPAPSSLGQRFTGTVSPDTHNLKASSSSCDMQPRPLPPVSPKNSSDEALLPEQKNMPTSEDRSATPDTSEDCCCSECMFSNSSPPPLSVAMELTRPQNESPPAPPTLSTPLPEKQCHFEQPAMNNMLSPFYENESPPAPPTLPTTLPEKQCHFEQPAMNNMLPPFYTLQSNQSASFGHTAGVLPPFYTLQPNRPTSFGQTASMNPTTYSSQPTLLPKPAFYPTTNQQMFKRPAPETFNDYPFAKRIAPPMTGFGFHVDTWPPTQVTVFNGTETFQFVLKR